MKLNAAYIVMFAMATSVSLAVENPSIEALVDASLRENPELVAYGAEVDAAKGARRQAGFFKNPVVSVEFGAREVRDSENVLQGNGTTVSIALSQTFEFPGKGTLRKAITAKNVEIAELALLQFRLSLAGKIRMLAAEYIAVSTEVTAAEAIHRRTSEIAARLASNKSLSGRALIESRLLQAGVLEVSDAIKVASVRKAEIRSELNALTGRPQDAPLVIGDSLRAPVLRTGDAALAFAAQNSNPLLLIRVKELERSQRELTAARLDIAPDFAIGPFFSRDVAGDVEQNVGGAVSAAVPVWDWNLGNIQSAKARAGAAEVLRVKAVREVEAQIASRLTAYRLTMRQLEAVPPDFSGELAKTSLLAETQLLNGGIGAQLYLEFQSAYLRSLKLSHQAILDAWKTYLDLDLLTGGHAGASVERSR